MRSFLKHLIVFYFTYIIYYYYFYLVSFLFYFYFINIFFSFVLGKPNLMGDLAVRRHESKVHEVYGILTLKELTKHGTKIQELSFVYMKQSFVDANRDDDDDM